MSRSSWRSKIPAIFFCLLSILGPPGFGQDVLDPHEEHARHIGFLVGPVYNFGVKKWSLGMGAEYEYVLPQWDRLLGFGVAAEADLAEQRHYELRLPLSVHPIEELTLFLSPGVQFSEQEEPRTEFAAHIGAEYEFNLKKYFLAPELDIAYVGAGFHITLAIHFGLGF